MDQSSPAEGTSETQSHTSPSDAVLPARVIRACARCRRQKLKCDATRPCTLCKRSSIKCEERQVAPPTRRATRKRTRQDADKNSAPPTRHQHHHHHQQSLGSITAATPYQHPRPPSSSSPSTTILAHSPADTTLRSPALSHHGSSTATERHRFGANSSAVGFAAHIFGDSAASHSSDISSIPGYNSGTSPRVSGGRTGLPRWRLITMNRPPPVVLEAMIDAYFDRMHWFIMVFHEPSFRRSAQQKILSSDEWSRDELGTILVALMVCAVGLQCVANDPSWPGHALLSNVSLEANTLLDAFIKEIRFHLVDLLDDCCIETVQLCSLLGTYYIFHASPTLAWSILGLSVRTGYAMALHCEDEDDGDQGYDPIMAQIRRRNWNHITVADTFAAMIYGRPASLDAAFSHLQPLCDVDDTLLGPNLSKHPLFTAPDGTSYGVSRLTFHVLKSRLYEILRQALNRFRVLRLQKPISAEDLTSLAETVQYLRSLLDDWKQSLPPLFNCEAGPQRDVLDSFQNDKSFSAEEQATIRHLSLQVLLLQVTYDGAIIMIHRPLLEYRIPSSSHHLVPEPALQVVRESLSLSVDAALRISRVPFARFRKHFAIAFVLMHFFTAGVILCIPPSIWPFSSMAHEAKVGTLRIIRACRTLRGVSRIAPHIEELLAGLLKLSLQQEVDNGLRVDGVDGEVSGGSSRNMKDASIQVEGRAQNSATSQNKNLQQDASYRYQIQDTSLDPQAQFPMPSPGPSLSHERGVVSMEDDPNGVGHMDIMTTADDSVGDSQMAFSDVRWPTMGYAGQRHEVDSQLDEVFGTFGQMLFNLVPNDPYSAWNWGNGP